ncbi:24874_t:CDS:2 [Gigaspora rosea]|nr:24874_t:CDS:2 [Gigaspora rosea]
MRFAVCKVEKVKGIKCAKKYRIGTSTSNCSTHLNNVHGITEEQVDINLVSSNTPHNKLRQLEFPLISEIIKILKPVSLTNEINIEKIEDIFVAINEDIQKRTDLDKSMQTSNALERVKETLYRAMLFYWKRDNILYLPSILDPCVKKIEFAPDKIDEVQELLKDKYNEMKNNLAVNSTTASTTTTLAQN